MIIRLKRIYNLASEYQREKQDDAWEKLFDYLHKIGFKNCYSDENELLEYFSKYMSAYGMYRKTKLNKEKLLKILLLGKEIYTEYLCNYSDEIFVKAWINTYYFLKKFGVSEKSVMITKLLMGFGGRTAAYDKRFLNSISSNPTFLIHGIKFFVEKLKRSGFKELKTHGDKNIIPWERVLDMAFWYADKENEFLIEI